MRTRDSPADIAKKNVSPMDVDIRDCCLWLVLAGAWKGHDEPRKSKTNVMGLSTIQS